MTHKNIASEDFLRNLFNFASSFRKTFEKYLQNQTYLLYIKDPVTNIFHKHKIIKNNSVMEIENESFIYLEINKLICYTETSIEDFNDGIMLFEYKDKYA